MIIDVHTHIPTHLGAVPRDEESLNQVMRPDVSVRLNNSFEDYIRDWDQLTEQSLSEWQSILAGAKMTWAS